MQSFSESFPKFFHFIYNMNMFDTITRHKSKRIYSEKEKKCSVLIPLVFKENEWHILFEIRSHALKKQPGEICFPGGRMEKEDLNSKSCALRETQEELLISPENIEYIGELDYFLSPSNLRVDVHVGILLDYKNTFNEEVESVFTVPLSYFLENEPELYYNTLQTIPDPSFPFEEIPNGKDYKFSKGLSDTPVYRYKEHFIWGLTARVLYHNIQYFK